MNLYLIKPKPSKSDDDDDPGYDTYSAAIVCAASEADAKRIHPSPRNYDDSTWTQDNWAKSPEDVTVQLIGTAHESIEPGIVMSDYFEG